MIQHGITEAKTKKMCEPVRAGFKPAPTKNSIMHGMSIINIL